MRNCKPRCARRRACCTPSRERPTSTARWRHCRRKAVDAGKAVAAERASAAGLLRWRIAGRADGALLYGGALPTLIEWGDMHPADSLPASAVSLSSLSLGGLPGPVAEALNLHGVELRSTGPALSACLDTPRGKVWLHSGV